jgi:hypothetical protein
VFEVGIAQLTAVRQRSLHERAGAIHEKVLGPEHSCTATRLALMLHLHDDHTTARQLFERALAIHEKVLGPNHPDTATSLSKGSWATRIRKSASISRRYDIPVRDCDRSDSGISRKSRRSNVQRHASSITGAPFQRTNEGIQSQQLREKYMYLVAKISTSGERFRGTSLQQLVDRFSEIPDKPVNPDRPRAPQPTRLWRAEAVLLR